jgi:alkylhydroperoxidase/carboxymuconolactone decarboxylase family protein YurZ/predicted MFS family arabinose efflux permease
MVALLPIMASVFVAFLVSGLAMPVLPLHVHNGLGLSTFVVGLVAGSQFVAALISRPMAGHHADSRGAKHTVVTGLLAATASGLLYFLALQCVRQPTISVAILLVGRAVLGIGESFVITGAQTWGLLLGGPKDTGKVIAWAGSAMWASFALGAPAGTFLYATFGFPAIAMTTTFVPVVALLTVARLPQTMPTTRPRSSFTQVVASVWLPGLGLAFSGAAFGAMTAFVALLFASRGWTVWPAFTVFAGVFILARAFLGHVADNLGGAKVALICVLIEALGQALIWIAPWSWLALVGAALTGLGWSLVYPAFGIEAVRRAPVGRQGTAMGAFTAFLDLALGIATPTLGLIAAHAGLNTVFLASAIAILFSAAIAFRLLVESSDRQAEVAPPARAFRRRSPRRLALTIALLALVGVPPLHAQENTTMNLAKPQLTYEDVRAVAPALEAYTKNRLLGDVWKRPGLAPRDRSIITVAALITRNQTIDMAYYFNLALDNGVKPAELSEIITHLAFYAGWANSMSAVAVAKEVFAERKIGTDQLPAVAPSPLPLNEAAEAARKQRVGEMFDAVFPGVTQYTTDVLFRDLWLRPDLAPRDRSLVTISALLASGQVAQLAGHINIGMNNGLKQAEIAEVFTHLVFYVGWPNIFTAMPIAKDAFEKRPH